MKKKIQIFEKPPEQFKPQAIIAGCYLEWEKRVLLLKRQPEGLEGNTWCLPAGKVNEGETALQGALRELEEETGISLMEHDVQKLGTIYLRILPAPFDYCFSIFYRALKEKPHLHVDPREHIDAKWVPFESAFDLPLIHGGHLVLRYCKTQIEKIL